MPSPLEVTLVRQGLNWAEVLRYRWEYMRRLRFVLAQVDPGGRVRVTRHERQRVREFHARHRMPRVAMAWYRLFKALTGRVDPRYVPEEVFRVLLEPMLCRRDVALGYHDKNQLDRLLPDVPRPRTVLRNIYGHYYDHDYRPVPHEGAAALLGPGRYVLKPSITGTGSGRNVALVERTDKGFRIDGIALSLAEVERIYVQDFLVQDIVRQHSWTARFHPGSLNTLRVITLRLNGAIRPIAATLRMGNGSHVDNGHAGGLLCGVDLADARLTPFACDVLFRRHDAHPISGARFADQAVPSFEAVKSLAAWVHERMPYFDILSCDIALLEDGRPCLVEVNTFGQGVEPHQFLKGAPLFGDDTEAVLTLVADRRRAGWNR